MKKNYSKLLEVASKVKKNSYSPYSKFKVGAAVLTKKGKIFAGTNVENSSYGLTVCAEKNAVCNAISHGGKDIIAIAIVSDSKDLCMPCGSCLQFLSEFNENMEIVVGTRKRNFLLAKLNHLLPIAFNLKK